MQILAFGASAAVFAAQPPRDYAFPGPCSAARRAVPCANPHGTADFGRAAVEKHGPSRRATPTRLRVSEVFPRGVARDSMRRTAGHGRFRARGGEGAARAGDKRFP